MLRPLKISSLHRAVKSNSLVNTAHVKERDTAPALRQRREK